MNVPSKPEEWLRRLGDELANKQSRVTRLRSYTNGNAPLPEGAENMRDAYREFQRKARTNLGEIVVDGVQERMVPAGFRIGDSREMDADANRIWADNQLDVFSGDVHTDMLAVGHGFSIVGPGSDGPVITCEDPANIAALYDPLRPTRIRAALKMYRDSVAGKDCAFLYLPGRVYPFAKDSPDGGTFDVGGLLSDGTMVELPDDMMPVVPFINRGRGRGEFETHTDTLDRINYLTLQVLVLVALQAFRQRAIKGFNGDEVDENNEAVDYSSAFRPGPGALWLLPEGADIWESQYTDVTPVLTAIKDSIRMFAVETRTPISMLLPEGANQSAEGANASREDLWFKAKDRNERAKYGWNEVMRMALTLDGKRPSGSITTEFLAPERLTLSEKADAASKLQAFVPWPSLMRSIMQYAPDEITRMQQERLSDAFTQALGKVTSDGV